MIFVNSLIKQIGQECLIFNYKAQEFYKKVEIEDEDFNRLLYILVGREATNLSPIKKRTLLLVVLYNQYNINPTAKTIFDKEFLSAPADFCMEFMLTCAFCVAFVNPLKSAPHRTIKFLTAAITPPPFSCHSRRTWRLKTRLFAAFPRQSW